MNVIKNILVTIMLSAVQRTCLFTAFRRAQETLSANPLIKDMIAVEIVDKYLSEQDQDDLKNNGFYEDGKNWLSVRTHFIDEKIINLTKNNDISQIVILGAGLDTRVYRLSDAKFNHHFKFYEIDNKEINAMKNEILSHHKPLCNLYRIDGDINNLSHIYDQLLLNMFDPKENTIWITEGLLEYLEPHVWKELFSFCNDNCNKTQSALIGTFFDEKVDLDLKYPFATLLTKNEMIVNIRKCGWNIQVYDSISLNKLYNRDLLDWMYVFESC